MNSPFSGDLMSLTKVDPHDSELLRWAGLFACRRRHTAERGECRRDRLECKKITTQDVVCRAITSDGELARDIEIQLLATGDYRVLIMEKQTPPVSMRLIRRPMSATT